MISIPPMWQTIKELTLEKCCIHGASVIKLLHGNNMVYITKEITLGKNHINAANVIQLFHKNVIFKFIKELTLRRKHITITQGAQNQNWEKSEPKIYRKGEPKNEGVPGRVSRGPQAPSGVKGQGQHPFWNSGAKAPEALGFWAFIL